MNKTNRLLRLLMVVIAFLVVATTLTASVDILGADTVMNTGEVVHKKMIPESPIPVIDTCQESLDPECLYELGPGSTRYGLVLCTGTDARLYPVPKSYYYTVRKQEHIPVLKSRGFLTGIVYADNIYYPIKKTEN